MPWFVDLLESNHQPERRMQENCLFGSEGGAKLSFVPTPILLLDKWTAANAPDRASLDRIGDRRPRIRLSGVKMNCEDKIAMFTLLDRYTAHSGLLKQARRMPALDLAHFLLCSH